MRIHELVHWAGVVMCARLFYVSEMSKLQNYNDLSLRAPSSPLPPRTLNLDVQRLSF